MHEFRSALAKSSDKVELAWRRSSTWSSSNVRRKDLGGTPMKNGAAAPFWLSAGSRSGLQQQRIDRLQVLLAQRAGGLLQLQAGQDRVVARLGQVGAGLVQLALGIQ